MTRWDQLRVSALASMPCAELALVYKDHKGYHIMGSRPDRINKYCSRTEFAADMGQRLDIIPEQEESSRIIVLGAGQLDSSNPQRSAIVGGHLYDAMVDLRVESVRLQRAEALGAEAILENLVLGSLLHSFRLDQNRAFAPPGFRPRELIVDAADVSRAEHAVLIANAVNRVRAWVSQPANLLSPKSFAEESRTLEAHGLTVRVLEPEDLERLHAGALLAVGRGSEHGARMVAAEWRGDPEREGWDVALVGKGLTFDGGGLNLKSRPIIEKMKFDMSGGAAVLGALQLAASRQSRCNVVALVPMVENVIDALAYRPGDVITSMAGLTIEVIDTDAEGRLVLADALTYGIRTYDPKMIIDVATLTGAVTSVLHEEFAACYSTDDDLAEHLTSAGEAVGERLWRLPLDASQDYLVESEVADVANVGAPGFLQLGRGSPTAGAKFLQRFVPKTPWAHIDMTGTAWASRRNPVTGKGATGFGVRLIDRWLSDMESRAIK